MLRSGKVVRTKKYVRPRRDSNASLDEDIILPTPKVSRTPRKVLKSTNRNYRRGRGRPRKVVICDVCSKVFPNADDYNAHSFIHLGEEEVENVENHAVSVGSMPTITSKPRNEKKSVSRVSLECPKSSKAGHFKQQKLREKSVHSTEQSADIASAVSNTVVPTENCSSKLKRMKKKRKKSDHSNAKPVSEQTIQCPKPSKSGYLKQQEASKKPVLSTEQSSDTSSSVSHTVVETENFPSKLKQPKKKRKKSDSNAKPNEYLKKKKSKDNASREKWVKEFGLFESLAGEISEKELVSGDLQDSDGNLDKTKLAKKPTFSTVLDCVSPNADREKSSVNISLSDSNVLSIRESSVHATHLVKSNQTDAGRHSFAVENDCEAVIVSEPICDVQSSEEVHNSHDDHSNCEITPAESDTVVEASTVSNDRPETMNFTSKSRNFLKSKNSDSKFMTNVFTSCQTPVSSRTSENRVVTSANKQNTEAPNQWVIREKAGRDKIQPVEIAETNYRYPLHSNEQVVSANISNVQKNTNCQHDRECSSEIHLNEPVVSANNSNTQPQKDLNRQLSSADACSQSLKDFTSAKVSSNDDINLSVRKTMTAIENVSSCSQIHGEVYSTDASRLEQSTSEMCTSENDSFDDLPFECDWCGRTFKNNTLLTSHWSVHTACKRYVCRFCGRSFTSKQSLRKHSIVHKDSDAKATSTSKSSRHAAKVVIRNKTVKSIRKRSRSVREFSCSECGEKFSKKIKLLLHRTVRTCRICEITYHCQASYLLHNRELHETACYVCGESIFNDEFLTNHIKTHAAEKVNVCIECGDVFPLRSGLLDHFAAHEGLGKHVCELCGFPFVTRADYRDHRRNRHLLNRHLTQPRVTRSIASDTDIGINSLQDIAPTKIPESHG